MKPYHKIQSIYKRDTRGKFLLGQWSRPELEYLQSLPWYWDEKVDGTNIRVHWDTQDIRFGGRTDKAQIQVTLLDELNRLFSSGEMKDKYPDTTMTLYGEGYGARIQKGGGNYRPDNSFCLFDVSIGEFWLERDDVQDIAKVLQLEVVPPVGCGTIAQAIEYVKGSCKSHWGDFRSEGLVLRPMIQLFNKQGNRIITKVKCKDFT